MPEFGVYLLNNRPEPAPWEARWIRWPDFGPPTDRHDAHDALREAPCRAANMRVEIASAGGRGRTGTAVACLAVVDCVSARQAVAYVREHDNRRAVETPLAASLRQPLRHVIGSVPIDERHAVTDKGSAAHMMTKWPVSPGRIDDRSAIGHMGTMISYGQ